MSDSVTRRSFLATSAVAATAGMTCGTSRAEAGPFKTTLHKSLIGNPTEKTLADMKAAGFEGIESNQRGASPQQPEAARKIADKLGMRIHSVLYGWANFNKAGSVDREIASVETSLRAAQGFGADAVLLVPCKIGGVPSPQPWEFDIEFCEKTGHIEKVVDGDNTPYQKYIEAHNHATDTSREAVKRLIDTAEKTGVIIALENVWNNLWVKPAIFRNFIASFDSPWVQCYFDIGNHTKYAMPEEWIRELGELIVECHVKDFRLKPDGRGGSFCDIRDGSIDWPLVRRELDKIGYSGWMTIEGSGGLSMEERNKRLDLIIAGK